MVVQEDGPLDIFVKLRNFLGVRYTPGSEPFGTTWISRGILCIWCVSFWVSYVAVLAREYSHNNSMVAFVVAWFAISAFAIVIDRLVGKL